MGNTEQKIISIDQNFNKLCHPGFVFGKINPQENTIEISALYDTKYQQWRWNLYPMTSYSKYLLQPKYFLDKNIHINGCVSQKKNNPSLNNIIVGYQPFIYTLQNEIMSRKFSKTKFLQKQIWKISKYVLQALSFWLHIYNDLPIGQILPHNIIFDSKGHTKLVNNFSFPPGDLIKFKESNFRYNQVNPMNSLLKSGPRISLKQLLTQSLRQLLTSLLSVLSLQLLSKESYLYPEYEKKITTCNNISNELKNFMLQMLNVQDQQNFFKLLNNMPQNISKFD